MTRTPIAVFTAATRRARFANEAWRAIVHDEVTLPPAAAEHFDDVVEHGTPVHLDEVELRGGRRGALTLEPCCEPGCRPELVIAVCSEVAGEPSERASELKDQFLAVVSHELRAPLTTMLLWEKVLRDPSADSDLHAQALDAIRQSAELQSRLVGDLLDISRATSGKLRVDLRPVDITHVIEDAVQAIAPALGAKRIAFDLRIDSTIGVVKGDAGRLRQVLDNLLSNALKFTDQGGRVAVSARPRGRAIVIDVADTGRGIAKEFLPRLFDPFSQTDDALTRIESGLGLGLAIARQLVTLHGGTLEAASPGRGKGATFTLTLPTSDVRLPTSPANRRAPALDHVRVLVVDDDPRARDALAVLLRRAGAIVDTAESAEAARPRISRHHAVLLCDIAMPNEDGYDLVRKLRAAGYTLPAIALTAHGSAGDAQHAHAAGFDRHVVKPIEFERLVENINDVIASRALR